MKVEINLYKKLFVVYMTYHFGDYQTWRLLFSYLSFVDGWSFINIHGGNAIIVWFISHDWNLATISFTISTFKYPFKLYSFLVQLCQMKGSDGFSSYSRLVVLIICFRTGIERDDDSSHNSCTPKKWRDFEFQNIVISNRTLTVIFINTCYSEFCWRQLQLMVSMKNCQNDVTSRTIDTFSEKTWWWSTDGWVMDRWVMDRWVMESCLQYIQKY